MTILSNFINAKKAGKLPKELIGAINQDITQMLGVRNSPNFSFIENHVEDLGNLLNYLAQRQSSQESGDESLFKPIRLFVLVLENSFNGSVYTEAMQDKVEKIKKITGEVPSLNSTVINTPNMKDYWGEIPYTNPKRGKNGPNISFADFPEVTNAKAKQSKKENIDFCPTLRATIFGESNASDDEDLSDESDVNGIRKAMSAGDGQPLPLTELPIDHFEPSAAILEKQKELINAMNIDPVFRAQQKELAKTQNKGYFLESTTVPSVLVGTKLFYMDYHNCLDNLWPLRGLENSRKSRQDPVTFLKGHALYKNFVKLVGEENIHKKTIIPTVTYEGRELPLQQAAFEWFEKEYILKIHALKVEDSQVNEKIKSITTQFVELKKIALDQKKSRYLTNNTTHELVATLVSIEKLLQNVEINLERREKIITGQGQNLFKSDTESDVNDLEKLRERRYSVIDEHDAARFMQQTRDLSLKSNDFYSVDSIKEKKQTSQELVQEKFEEFLAALGNSGMTREEGELFLQKASQRLPISAKHSLTSEDSDEEGYEASDENDRNKRQRGKISAAELFHHSGEKHTNVEETAESDFSPQHGTFT